MKPTWRPEPPLSDQAENEAKWVGSGLDPHLPTTAVALLVPVLETPLLCNIIFIKEL